MSRPALIGVIDYGMGNLRSVSKAIEHLGGSVYVGSERGKLETVAKLVLPGVGAFGDGIWGLQKRRLIPIIRKAAEQEKPILGICLGLQLFFEQSEENPGVEGLGIWKGSVVRFPSSKWKKLKIPHMGWNKMQITKRNPLLSGIRTNNYFYFVHSYYAKPRSHGLIIGETRYGVTFPAALASRNLFAVQFHPEKSQEAGLQILKNFVQL